MLSRRAKEAIKVGLAMAIAYGVALSMDWDRPYWAAFAVAMISLSTVGHSLNKGAMRMLGTLVGVAVALVLLALFHQDRWLLVAALSVYLALCTYMLTGKAYSYAWFVSAFVCVIIIVSAGPSSESAFEIAVERSQETGMGVLVYGLIAAFLWPKSSRSDLEGASENLVAAQVQLFGAYRDLMHGQGVVEASQPLRAQEVRLVGLVEQELSAAETDSYTVWEVRHLWRRFRDDTTALGEALERWRESFPEIQELDLQRLCPDLDAFCDEIEARLTAIEALWAGEAVVHEPTTISLYVEQKELRQLSHFQQAAATLTRVQLERIEELTRALLETVKFIKSFAVPSKAQRQSVAAPAKKWAVDVDRLVATLRVVATLWVGFLIWVYVDPPGHAAFVQLAVIIAMVVAMTPQLNPSKMMVPFALGSVFAGLVYVFVMPQLSGFAELGLVIFAVTTGIYYLFSAPQQALAKMGGIVTFVVLISVENEQSYDFAGYANKAAMIMLAITLVVVMAYIPTSPRPEKVFLRLFRRFFREVDFLLSRIALDWEREAGLAGRLRASVSSIDLMDLSHKLAGYGRQIDHRSFPGNTPEMVQALATSLTGLAFRMKELVESRESPQAELLVRELLDDMRAWRLAIQQQIHLWADDPETAAQESTDLQERLKQRLALLEARVEETFSASDAGELSARDYENFYRLLGHFRGVSEAGLAFITIAREINWSQWREARF